MYSIISPQLHYFILFLDKKLLKPTAVPSLNLKLRKLTESELMDVTFIDTGHERPQSVLQEADVLVESRKRISNIIVVDLTKDKRAKYPERPKVLCLHFPSLQCLNSFIFYF